MTKVRGSKGEREKNYSLDKHYSEKQRSRAPTRCRWQVGETEPLLQEQNGGKKAGGGLFGETRGTKGGPQRGDTRSQTKMKQLGKDALKEKRSSRVDRMNSNGGQGKRQVERCKLGG